MLLNSNLELSTLIRRLETSQLYFALLGTSSEKKETFEIHSVNWERTLIFSGISVLEPRLAYEEDEESVFFYNAGSVKVLPYPKDRGSIANYYAFFVAAKYGVGSPLVTISFDKVFEVEGSLITFEHKQLNFRIRK